MISTASAALRRRQHHLQLPRPRKRPLETVPAAGRNVSAPLPATPPAARFPAGAPLRLAGPGRQATVAPGTPPSADATPPDPGADPPRAAGMSALPVPDDPDRPPGPRPTPMSRSPTALPTINASANAPRACGGVVGPRRRNEFSARTGPSTTLINRHPAGFVGGHGRKEAGARPRESRRETVGAD